MYRLYDFPASGNCYKVRLLLSHLDEPYERIHVDILEGEAKTPDHLAKNLAGKVPVLELGDGTCLAESNAILCYLAAGTPYFPVDPISTAQVMQWMFFEQNLHEPNIASARYWQSIRSEPGHQLAHLEQKLEEGNQVLAVMEKHLRDKDFFVGGVYTVADIALYAYTHVANEGGFEIKAFPGILKWLERVKAQPGHVSIED